MTYRFTESDGSVAQGLRRIAIDQIDKAVDEIDDSSLDVEETVHQVRKRCKKVRGLLRLIRPAFDGYGSENRAFRDAAKDLSNVRDAHVAIETYDNLIKYYAGQVDKSAYSSIRRRLLRDRRHACRTGELDEKLSEFRKTMTESRRRADTWTIDAEGFEALAGGLGKTYKRARKAIKRANADPEAAKLHEWRKRIKYHWHHGRLLREMWPEVVGAHRNAADELAELLGDHHDLAVLRDTLLDEPDAFGDPKVLEAFVGLIRRRQSVLEAESFAIGSKLLAEKPGAFVRRWGRYWGEWTSEIEIREQALVA